MRLLILLTCFIVPAAFAYPVGQYAGFGMGYTWTQATFNDQTRTLGATREVPSHSHVNDASLPWQAYYGFRFHPNYGIEVGYMNYGSIEFSKTLTTFDDSQSATVATSVRDAEVSSSGFFLQHVLSYPLLSHFVVQARAGILIGSTHYSDLETLTTTSDDTGTVTIVQPNSTYDGFIKEQLALSVLYQSSKSWYWRLQVNQLDVKHSEEKESFTQWFTSLSLEYQLED